MTLSAPHLNRQIYIKPDVKGFPMYIKRLLQRTTLLSLASLMIGSALVQIAAQDPQQSPRPIPQTPQTGDQSQNPGRQGKQSENEPQDLGNETIKIDTELVQLDVTVIDQNNNPIYGLSKNDFTVYEDKVKQQIESVSREEILISFGIVIDTSGSMRNKIQTVTDASRSLIRQKRPEDEGFVVQFKSESEIIQPFTKDENDLQSALEQLFTSGPTALLDAIILSSDYAYKQGKQRRKAIVVISDGLDKNSAVKEKEVIDAIKENEVQLYMIGFIEEGEPTSPYLKSPSQKARELLERLANDSGGRAFFPKQLSEIPAIAAQIAKDLRTQYVVSYYPANTTKDGTFRTVQVDVASKGTQRLVARSRQGYYARAEQ
jgi:Ca-activated chloride channel homolog